MRWFRFGFSLSLSLSLMPIDHPPFGEGEEDGQ